MNVIPKTIFLAGLIFFIIFVGKYLFFGVSDKSDYIISLLHVIPIILFGGIGMIVDEIRAKK